MATTLRPRRSAGHPPQGDPHTPACELLHLGVLPPPRPAVMVVSAMADRRTTETPGLSPVELKAVIEAERSGAPFLYWRDDAGTLQILRLAEDRWRVTVGRRMDADIPLPSDPEVSRAHALLEWVGGQWTVVDDGLSRNGTFVNG